MFRSIITILFFSFLLSTAYGADETITGNLTVDGVTYLNDSAIVDGTLYATKVSTTDANNRLVARTDEYLDMTVDGMIYLFGSGGTNDQGLTLDVDDATGPIVTPSSGTLSVAGDLAVTGTLSGDGSGLTGITGAESQWVNADGSIYYSAGLVGIGTTAQDGNSLTIGGTYPSLYIEGTSGQWASMYIKSRFNGASNGPGLFLQHDPGRASNSGDNLGYYNFSGTNTSLTSSTASARIEGFADGNATATDVPTGFRFKTSESGGAVTRMTVKANGNVGIGSVSPRQLVDVAGVVQIDGAIYLKSPDGTFAACGVSDAGAFGCTEL